jgi:hypothetical protein
MSCRYFHTNTLRVRQFSIGFTRLSIAVIPHGSR